MYYYSSGSKFGQVVNDLSEWIERKQQVFDDYMEDPDPAVVKPLKPQQYLKRLVDHDGLFRLLGDAIIEFMILKPSPYGANALRSKEHFWKVKVMKRSMTFVFLLRYLLGYPSQKQWSKFSLDDYKLNTRSFKRWEDKDHLIFQASEKFNGLPDTYAMPTHTTFKRRYKASASSTNEDSPMKRRYVVNDDSTDEDD